MARERKVKSKEFDWQSGSVSFSPAEKRTLLELIEEHGFHVVHDIDGLSEYFPHRSSAEIKYIIDLIMQRSNNWISQTSLSFERSKKLDEWLRVLHRIVPSGQKKTDTSKVLVPVCESLSQETTDTKCSGINYQLIYQFITQVLDGKAPKTLPEFESLVVMELFKTLDTITEQVNTEAEKQFLKSSSWNEPEAFELASTNPNSPESFFEIPLIRKLRQCLNPLRIPPNILSSKRDEISELLEKTLYDIKFVNHETFSFGEEMD